MSNILERFEYCQNYHNGCELGDAIGMLTEAANVMFGIGYDEEVNTILGIVESMIKDDIMWLKDNLPEDYEALDEIYKKSIE